MRAGNLAGLVVTALFDDLLARQSEVAAATRAASQRNDEFVEIRGVLGGDPAEDREIFVGVGEFRPEIGAEQIGDQRFGDCRGRDTEVEHRGKDVIGALMKVRRQFFKLFVNRITDFDVLHIDRLNRSNESVKSKMFIITEQVVVHPRNKRSATPTTIKRRVFAALQIIFAEIVLHIPMASVLFVDLQDASVLIIGGRENLGWFTWQEDRGEAAVTVDHSADDQHGRSMNQVAVPANPGCRRSRQRHITASN